MIYQALGCYRDAEREYVAARKISPRSIQAMLNLGSLYIQASDAVLDAPSPLEAAISLLKQAIERRPTSALAYSLLGAAYYKSSSYKAAEDTLKRALEIQSRMVSARLMLANIYLKQENWSGALEHLDAYLGSHPLASERAQVKKIRRQVAENVATR
jgi:tetratricopeptide (TPR) repeat protein